MFTIESYFYAFVNYFFLSYIHLYIVFLFLYQSLAKKEITLTIALASSISPPMAVSFFLFLCDLPCPSVQLASVEHFSFVRLSAGS